jgi:hypothetical protein
VDRAEFGGLAAKDAVIGGLVRVVEEVDTRSPEDDGGRDKDSGAEQVTEDDFDPVIVPRLRLRLGLERLRCGDGRSGSGHQIFPQNPL